MKKFSILLVAIVLMFAFTLYGCGDKNNDTITTIKVNEVTHSIFYAPLYVAINNGYFEQEGLKVELTNGGGADKSMTAILSGDADIGLMGPEAAIYVTSGGAQDKPVVFGQLTKRDGSFIVSKTAYENFSLNDLVGKEIIGGRKGGVPAMTLEYAIKQAGLEIGTQANQVNLRTDVAFDLTASVFDSTDAEFCTLFEPTASELCEEKGYHIVASVGELSGEVPYTAFIAKRGYIDDNPLTVERFLRAVYRGYRFLLNASVDEIAESLKPSFQGFSNENIIVSIQSYINCDAWVSNPAMTETAFDKLQSIIIAAGELEERVEFESVVDNTIAKKVVNYFI